MRFYCQIPNIICILSLSIMELLSKGILSLQCLLSTSVPFELMFGIYCKRHQRNHHNAYETFL